MNLITILLLGFLIVCAIAVSFHTKLLHSILIYMVYSVIMSIVWIRLESPDLAVTEAAVGAGITTVLFFVTLKKIEMIDCDAPDVDVEDVVVEGIEEEIVGQNEAIDEENAGNE